MSALPFHIIFHHFEMIKNCRYARNQSLIIYKLKHYTALISSLSFPYVYALCNTHKMMNTYMICIMSKSKLELKCPLSGLPCMQYKNRRKRAREHTKKNQDMEQNIILTVVLTLFYSYIGTAFRCPSKSY